MDDRRKRTRVPVRHQVRLLSETREVTLETLNISLKGMLCSGSDEVHPDEKCRVFIQLSPEAVVEIDGMVVRADAEETAIDFLSMDESAFHHLKCIVDYNAEDADQVEDELSKSAFGPASSA